MEARRSRTWELKSYEGQLRKLGWLILGKMRLMGDLLTLYNFLTGGCGELGEVLKQLQGSIEDEAMGSSGQTDLLERLKELNLESTSFAGVKFRPKVSVRSYGSREGSVSSCSGECSPVPIGSFPRRGFTNGSRESTGYLEELEKESLDTSGAWALKVVKRETVQNSTLSRD
ncbi:hypothetical protein DUI87_30725 [Hirundo rustica rustica]|uniref:Uncharacterized protein n=1 Tax=Hirundo rustica rustica TaxID=333673 RepID=A0A3M0ITY3_HIRRU|nr:hypothetical protein DUI87_30725 [Hirundo rustica rustica]